MTKAADIAPILGRVRRNLGVLATGGATIALLGVAAVAMNARALGPTLLGILALVQSYVVILCRVSSFDTWQGIVRFGAEAEAHNDSAKLVAIVTCAALLDIASAILSGVAGIIGLLLFAHGLGLPDIYVGPALFYSASLFFQLPGFPIGLMRLFDKFHWLTGISVAESAGRLAAAFILFLTHSGLPAYIYAYGTVLVTANLIRIAASFYLLHVETGSFRHPSLREIRAVARTFLRFSTGSWITSTLNVTRRDGSIFIVAAILGSAGAGYYSIAQRIVQPIKDVSEMLRQALFPELSRLVAKGEHKQVAELIRRVLFYTVPLAATIIIGVLLFGNVAVNLVAGPAFDKAYWILLGLATASSLYLCMPLLSSLVILYAGMKSYSTATAIAAAIWAALVTFPIYLWYARGAGVGEVIFVVSWLTICTVILRKSFARRIASGR